MCHHKLKVKLLTCNLPLTALVFICFNCSIFVKLFFHFFTATQTFKRMLYCWSKVWFLHMIHSIYKQSKCTNLKLEGRNLIHWYHFYVLLPSCVADCFISVVLETVYNAPPLNFLFLCINFSKASVYLQKSSYIVSI